MAKPLGRADSARKRDLAIDFIRRIRGMDRDALHELILGQAGEELSRFFLAYATDLIEREPQRASENASSLLLIGYLIRSFEDEAEQPAAPASTPFLH